MKVIVYGAGGHGKVVADILIAGGEHQVAGFVDDNQSLCGSEVRGLPVLGGQRWLQEKTTNGEFAIALGIGDNRLRRQIAERCGPVRLLVAVHPAAAVSKAAFLGDGTVVMAGAVVNPDAQVGLGVIINSGAVIEHDVVVGNYAHVSPNAAMGGGSRLGAESHLGLGAVILPGVSVGERAVIGAAAAVIRDIPDDRVALGVPARIRDA